MSNVHIPREKRTQATSFYYNLTSPGDQKGPSGHKKTLLILKEVRSETKKSPKMSREVTLIVAMVVVVTSAAPSPLISTVPIAVKRIGNRTSLGSYGVEGDLISCGNPAGEVLEVRVDDCERMPCECIIDQSYTIEIDFIPSINHPSLDIILDVIIASTQHPVINQAVPLPLEAGLPYTFQLPLLISPELSPGLIAIRLQLSEGGIVEFCGIGTANLLPSEYSRSLRKG